MVREALFRRLNGYRSETNTVDTSVLRDLGNIENIIVKPNWVRQQEGRGPCVTTHGSVLRPIIDYLLLAYGPDCHITVADVPLQSSNLDVIWAETGIDALRDHYRALSLPVCFLDWRREKAVTDAAGFIVDRVPATGDPSGYVEVRLGCRSFLEAVTTPQSVFSVNDYEPGAATSHHRAGRHGFLFPKSVLAADLFVNVPKLKTHCKAGITACMKNLIGINGDKGWIPHFRMGAPATGGDEFPNESRRILSIKSKIRNALQGHHRLAFNVAQGIWKRIQRQYEKVSGGQLLSGGAWSGNDTLWRSILDLVLAVTFADINGELKTVPQRKHLCVVDAVVCGEGEGPLNATPKPVGMVLCSLDPVSADFAACHVIGLDWMKIPQLREAKGLRATCGDFPESAETLTVSWASSEPASQFVKALPVFHLKPPKGWDDSICAENEQKY